MTLPPSPNLCLVPWCILMPATSPTAKPISIFIIMDVCFLSSILTLLIYDYCHRYRRWLVSLQSPPPLTTALQNETSLESRWVARSRTTSRTSKRCSTRTSRTPVSQVRLRKSLSLCIFLLLQNLTSIYLVGNPVTSNLSELCISPSKMRFKFPLTFIEFPSRPPPKPPPTPLHTLRIWERIRILSPAPISEAAAAFFIIPHLIQVSLMEKNLGSTLSLPSLMFLIVYHHEGNFINDHCFVVLDSHLWKRVFFTPPSSLEHAGPSGWSWLFAEKCHIGPPSLK